MGDIFDNLASLDVRLDKIASQPRPRRLPRHKGKEWFLRGPVPWTWLERAAALPGKALFVALTLWRIAGWKKYQPITFSVQRERGPSLNQWAARRGLRALEAAGLIEIQRLTGHALRVTLLHYPGGSPIEIKK